VEVAMSEKRKWFAGVDWGSENHAVCLLDEGGNILGERFFEHSGEGLAELLAWLEETAVGSLPTDISVAIETPHGAVVDTLLERGLVVHTINPKQVDRFRDRFSVAGSKDDRRDARVLADSLRTDGHCYRLLRGNDAATIELREWSRLTAELQEERGRLANRVQDQLRRYFPQLLELATDRGSDSFLALWKLVPTPAKAKTIRKDRVASFLKKHRIRRFDAEHVLTTLRQKPLYVAPGTIEAATAHIESLAERLALVNKQLRQAHGRLDDLFETLSQPEEPSPGQASEQCDVDILRSLPGVGRIVLATLLAEASQPIADRDYHALRALTGVAPVTQASGKRRVVSMRYACHHRLREAGYHWARVASQVDPRSKASYKELRQRGHSHGRALRTVSDALLRLACAMLRSRSLFDPEQWNPTPAAAA
jgi:transposase